MNRLLIYGAGGHGKVVCEAARLSGFDVVGFVDARAPKIGVFCDAPVALDASEFHADCFVVAVGDNQIRERIFSETRRTHAPATIIHPSAVMSRTCELGLGCVVLAGVIANPDSAVGENTILNTGCRIEHDSLIGNHVHVAPGACIAGAVHVGDGTLFGIGAVAIPGVRIGCWSTVAAGAVVTVNVADSTTVVGVPARAQRMEVEG